MDKNKELEKIGGKNYKYCYFEDIVNIKRFDTDNIFSTKNHTKIF